MANLSDIINLKIVDETRPQASARFDLPLFVASHKRFTGLYREINDPSELLEIGFLATSTAYLAATAYFSQEANGRPDAMFIGRREATRIDILATVLTAATNYTLTFDVGDTSPITITWTSGGVPTANDVAVGLQGEIAANATINALVATTINVDTLELTNQTGKDFGLKSSSSNLDVTFDFAGAETYETAVTNIRVENDTFYMIMIDSHADADILEMSSYAESVLTSEGIGKLYFTSTSEVDVLNPALSTDIMSQLKTLSRRRTWIIYNALADTTFIESAAAGVILPATPGTAIVAYNTLIGMTADILTDTQSHAVRGTKETGFVDGKCGNTYEPLAGTPTVLDGLVSSREFIDIIRSLDWLQSQITLGQLAQLFTVPKVPDTDAGLLFMRKPIIDACNLAQNDGMIFNFDPKKSVTKILASDLTDEERRARRIDATNGYKINVQMTGAIQFNAQTLFARA